MRASWVVAIVLGLAVIVTVISVGEVQSRRQQLRHQAAYGTARLVNECLRMYVTDFSAFPPTADTAQVVKLILPYVPPDMRERVPGHAGIIAANDVEFRFRPGLTKGEAGDRSTFETARFHTGRGAWSTYLDGRVAEVAANQARQKGKGARSGEHEAGSRRYPLWDT